MSDDVQKPLRRGYTTGSCATATAKAALLSLIKQAVVDSVDIALPIGEIVKFSLLRHEISSGWAECGTIKDGGDDPDATHGAEIRARVEWTSDGVVIEGGEGVGRVTKPGLPVSVGQAAINPTPRKMIDREVRTVLAQYRVSSGVKVTISVPNGEEIAKKTLNGRLGILGGISILGNRGVVVPFSTSAYKASIVQAMNVARSSLVGNTIVLTTGGRSEKYAMKLFPTLPEESFVEMGDFVGFSVKQAGRLGFTTVRFVGMMGKFSKVAQGIMMVHAKSAPVDFQFLSRMAEQAGIKDLGLLKQIRESNTASQVADIIWEAGYPEFFSELATQCSMECQKASGKLLHIETVLTTLTGMLLGRGEVGGGETN